MPTFARFFDGSSSKAKNVYLVLGDTFLCINDEDGNELDRWPLEQLRDENAPPIDDRLSLSLSEESSARLLVEDREDVQNILSQCLQIRKPRLRPQGWWRPYILVGGTAIASVALFFMFGLPLLASAVADLVPIETRTEIGKTIEGHMIKKFASEGDEGAAVCKSKTAQKALEDLVLKFAKASGREFSPITITVVKSKSANAFALPGNRMVILSSLIEKADNPSAFAGIVAHEFGHIEGKHPTSLFVANIGVAAILSLAFGDVTGGTIIAGVSQMALGASYSRDFERYADKKAIDYMSAWKYDISPSIKLLEKLEAGQKKKAPSFFSFFASHPDTQERIDQLRSVGKTGEVMPFTDTQWQAIKVMCEKSV